MCVSLTVKEVVDTLDGIQSSIEQCLPLLNRLNQLLPDCDRLEPFQLQQHQQEVEVEEEEEERRGGEGRERQDETMNDFLNSTDNTLS